MTQNNELAGNASLSGAAANSVGYCSDRLMFNGTHIHFGKHVIPARTGGLDHTPGEVEEILLVEPVRRRDRGNDAAVIKFKTKTPFQEFLKGGTRTLVEWTDDEMVWMGRLDTGETIVVNPRTVYSLKTRKNEGSVVYGPGTSGAWVNMEEQSGELFEYCIPRFCDDGTIQEFDERDPRETQLFWGLWEIIKSELYSRGEEYTNETATNFGAK